MTTTMQIRLCGLGGQGVVLAGLLLGQAGVLEGKFVSGSNSYGAQARGSECKSEIVVSDSPIDFPYVIAPDFLISMSQAAYDFYAPDLKRGGLILYDKGFVSPRPDRGMEQIGIPASDYALRKVKNGQMMNLVLLGAFSQLTGRISPRAIRRAIRLHIQERFRAINMKAFETGLALGRR